MSQTMKWWECVYKKKIDFGLLSDIFLDFLDYISVYSVQFYHYHNIHGTHMVLHTVSAFVIFLTGMQHYFTIIYSSSNMKNNRTVLNCSMNHHHHTTVEDFCKKIENTSVTIINNIAITMIKCVMFS